MTISFTPHQAQTIAELRQALEAAGHGRKGHVLDTYAQRMQVAKATLHRWLAQAPAAKLIGYQRQRRSDAGRTAATYDELQAIGTALAETYRKTGNRIMTFEGAVEMLRANNVISTDLSHARLTTLLAKNGLHPSQMTRPTPHVQQQSMHPNHVWQVDASVCVAYYLSNATGLQVLDEKKFYKNKPKELSRIQQERLIRYAVADHYSHTILVRYFIGSESAANLGEMLMWAFSRKDLPDGAGMAHAMHGVPEIVQMDMGSANTSHEIRRLLERLQVRVMVHERHNSRANGSVEKAHHLVELHFESGLRFQHVDDLADLNAKALAWSHNYCATRSHTRYDNTRYSSWMRITAGQLRVAPAPEVLRELCHTEPKTRRVSNNLTVSFVPTKRDKACEYDVRHVPGIRAGDVCKVVVNAYRAPSIDVAYIDADTGEELWMEVAPQAYNEAGFLVDAPMIGVDMRTPHRGILEHARDGMLLAAYGSEVPAEATTHTERIAAAAAAKEAGKLVFGGTVDPFKRVADAQLPTYMSKRGVPLDIPQTRQVAVARLNVAEACTRIRDGVERLGYVQAYDAATVYPWIASKYGDEGMPEDQVEPMCNQLIATLLQANAPADTQAERAPLRAVGGGAA
jgi:transposase InsO family protein